MPTLFATADQQWSAWEFASGSTSTVLVGEPLIEPHKHSSVALKELVVRADRRHEIFFRIECEVLQRIATPANPVFTASVPRLVAAIEERWTIVIAPVGVRLHTSAITSLFVEELVIYLTEMWKLNLVDLDLRGRNIMMVRAGSGSGWRRSLVLHGGLMLPVFCLLRSQRLDHHDVGHFFKVDFASVVTAGVRMTEYHGTDRFAHPEILRALLDSSATGGASAASSSSAHAARSPTSASSFALQFTPHLSHMLYSAAATVLWLIHLPTVHTEGVRAAGNDWSMLLEAWKKVRAEDLQAAEVLQAAEKGNVDDTLKLLCRMVNAAQTERTRASSL